MCKNKLFIVSWYGTSNAGGVERVTQYMAEAWAGQYDVEIIDFNKMCKKRFYQFFLKKHYVLDCILTSIYVHQILHKSHIDTKVITQGYMAPFIHADIHVAHGIVGDIGAACGDYKYHVSQTFQKIAAKKAKKIIAISEKTKQKYIDLYHIEKNKIQVIGNCVDTEAYYPKERDRTNDIINVLFAGRLEKKKGISKLIELAEHIEKISNMRLFIATNNSENVELFSKFAHTKIKCALNQKEMNDFYNSGHVMFFPSLYESFGLVVIEALSAGIPVMGNMVEGVFGDLYLQGAAGIALIDKNMDKNIEQIIQLSEKYKDFADREILHESMVLHYSFEAYKDKLEKIWGEV